MANAFDGKVEERAAWLFEAVAASPVALVALDRDHVVRWWSPGAESLFGWTAEHAVGRAWEDVGVVTDPIRRRQASRALDAAIAGPAGAREWVTRRPDGSTVSVRTVAQPLGGDDVEDQGVLLITIDVSGRDEFEHALVREALLDPLTALPNRVLILDELARVVSDRRSPQTAAVLFVDLDGFKAVNDLHGHGVGDLVLIEVARRLRACLREGDVVGRLSGDEFVLVCRVTGLLAGVPEVAQRVAASLAEPIEAGGVAVHVTASVGVAIAEAGVDVERLVRRADRAMYAAKGAGKGTYHMILTD